jgi:hypothetical protein
MNAAGGFIVEWAVGLRARGDFVFGFSLTTSFYPSSLSLFWLLPKVLENSLIIVGKTMMCRKNIFNV